MEEGQRCPRQQTWEASPYPRSALCGCGLFSSPGRASHVSHMLHLTRSCLCPGQTPLREEERAEEGCHQVPASSQKYICPLPAVCDLALLSRALSEDRCPPLPQRGADPMGGCKWVEMSRCSIPECSTQESHWLSFPSSNGTSIRDIGKMETNWEFSQEHRWFGVYWYLSSRCQK